MSHYFHTPEDPLVTHEFTATIFGRELTFTAASGVFSGNRLDLGTSVLLREVDPPVAGHVLDLGCGVGTIAVGLALASPEVCVDAVDVIASSMPYKRDEVTQALQCDEDWSVSFDDREREKSQARPEGRAFLHTKRGYRLCGARPAAAKEYSRRRRAAHPISTDNKKKKISLRSVLPLSVTIL